MTALVHTLTATMCPICRGDLLPSLTAPERMFGLGGEWHYGECRSCGSLHLLNPPADLSPYDPQNYDSMQPPPALPLPTGIRRVLWRWRNHGQLTQRGLAGIVARLRPRPDTVRVLNQLRDLRYCPSLDTRILDIGCGHGDWVARRATRRLHTSPRVRPIRSSIGESAHSNIEFSRIEPFDPRTRLQGTHDRHAAPQQAARLHSHGYPGRNPR